eukprot:TRINITY_DN227_c0_g1_i1.p1 TRINITY_DN227_c0_g1~~TRINITY_DN227_c0_g1_i1.p1  ORF type:complete len:664 (+),score=240.60 TRINITY_DN227_c0_g1_i1:127-2118(+)
MKWTIVAAVLACAAGVCGAEPAKFVWNPLVAVGDWHNESNWMPIGVPGPDDFALISGLGGTITVNLTQSTTVGWFGIGRGCTLGVDGVALMFGNSSLVDAGAMLYIGAGSTLLFAHLEVRGNMDVVAYPRDAWPKNTTALVGLLPPTVDGKLITPVNQLVVYATTQLLGYPGVWYLNLTNLVLTNYGHLHLGGYGGSFLQVWMTDYSVINNMPDALFDMEQPGPNNEPYYYYVIAGFLSTVKIINSGTWVIGACHVSEVDQEHHGLVNFVGNGGAIDGHVLTGSTLTWNFTTPSAGVNSAGFNVDVKLWRLVGPGGIRFSLLGLGVQAYVRFQTGRLEIDTEVDFVSVKIAPTFDMQISPSATVRFMRWIAVGPDIAANVLDGVRLVNRGTIVVDADASAGYSDILWLNNGATIVNDVNANLSFTAMVYNLTISSTEGAQGAIYNLGAMDVSYPYYRSNPALGVPLHSNGTIYIKSGNFTTGAGLFLNRPRGSSSQTTVLLGVSARLVVANNSLCVIESIQIDSVNPNGLGSFAQQDESTVRINLAMFVGLAKYEWYGGAIEGLGSLYVSPNGTMIASPNRGLKHIPKLTARFSNKGVVRVRGGFQVGDGAWFLNYATVDIQQTGSIWFTPNCTWSSADGAHWEYQARVARNGTTLVCSSCYY